MTIFAINRNVAHQFTVRELIAVISGTAAFVANRVLRGDSYRQIYSHLPPSIETLSLTFDAGVLLGMESAAIALAIAAVVYYLIGCVNRR